MEHNIPYTLGLRVPGGMKERIEGQKPHMGFSGVAAAFLILLQWREAFESNDVPNASFNFLDGLCPLCVATAELMARKAKPAPQLWFCSFGVDHELIRSTQFSPIWANSFCGALVVSDSVTVRRVKGLLSPRWLAYNIFGALGRAL